MKHALLIMTKIVITMILLTMLSCGVGGGKISVPAYIDARLNSLPPGSLMPNSKSASVYVVDSSTGTHVADAAVSINSVPLIYNESNSAYEGDVAVAPGESVALTASWKGYTYTASGSQFNTYPVVTSPISGTTWPLSCDNTITWSGADLSADTKYLLGVFNAANGEMIWPAVALEPTTGTSFVIAGDRLTIGERIVLVGISRLVSIPGAVQGSSLTINGFAAVPISITAAETLVNIAVTPSSMSVAPGGKGYLEATGTYCSNGSTYSKYITSLVTWSSSSTAVATFGNTVGTYMEVNAVSGGTATIMASSGKVAGSSVLTTTDWTVRSSGTSQDLDGVASSGTQYVVVGRSGTILTSPDGIVWTKQVSPYSNTQLLNVIWSGSQFVAVGDSIFTSPDGITWTLRVSGIVGQLSSVVWSGSRFVAVGTPGIIYTSPDGITWTLQNLGTGTFNGIAWTGTQFVIVGAPGLIRTSPDGLTWTSRDTGDFSWLSAVVWSGAKLVAIGNATATSSDGVTWLLATPDPTAGAPNTLRDVTWTGEQFLAVGDDNTIRTSSDGVTWTSSPSGIMGGLVAVEWSGAKYVAVGRSGMIVTSP